MHVFIFINNKAKPELSRQVEVPGCSDVAAGVEMLSGRYRGLLTPPVTGHWAQYLIIAGSAGSRSSNWHQQQPSSASCPAPGPPPRMLGHALVTSTIYAVVQHRASYVLDIKDSTFCPILFCIPYHTFKSAIYTNVSCVYCQCQHNNTNTGHWPSFKNVF